MQTQATFNGGLNAVAAPDKIADNEVQYAKNIDFSLSNGAALCRRGSRLFSDIGVASRIKALYINHNSAFALGSDPVYTAVGSIVYRKVGGIFTPISTGVDNELVPFSFWNEQTVFSNGVGTGYGFDDGTNTVQWIKEAPGTAVSVTVGTSYTVLTASAWAALEGTLTSTTTASATATESAGLGRISLTFTPASTNLAVDGTNVIGDWGVHYWTLKFAFPESVSKVSIDYSIGDTNFNNYYHSELQGEGVSTNTTDAAILVDAAVTGSEDTDTPITNEQRDEMFSDVRIGNTAPTTQISKVANAANVIGIPRPEIVLVGRYDGSGWADIKSIRIVVESDGDQTLAVGNFIIGGNEAYPLTDITSGLHYWETWATLDAADNVLYESAPSPISTDVLCQHAQTTLVSNSTPVGTDHGFTHRIFYRSGGYLRDAYGVGTITIATTSFVDKINDIAILSDGNIMSRGIYHQGNIPGNISCISEPHLNRLFAAYTNKVIWSLPGQPSSFPKTSETDVSSMGDEVYSLISWYPSIVIINRDSIYEMSGTVFEGDGVDWTLFRTGSKRGTKAPKVSIKTPYGIPLLDYDGIYMYVPGSGVESPIQWVMDKIGDAWKGEQGTDPATQKGSRVPYINRGYIRDSFAIFANDRLYLAVPTGASTVPNTIFIIDFLHKRVWWYQYPFSMTCGAWEFVENRLYVGTPTGQIMEIEIGKFDQDTGGVPTEVDFAVTSRQWSFPSKTIITNCAIDYQMDDASGNLVAQLGPLGNISIDTIPPTLGTRDKFHPSLSGYEASFVAFKINGVQSISDSGGLGFAGVYSISWDMTPLPEEVRYARTQVEIPGGEQEWKAVACELDCLGGNVVGILHIDALPISTFTYTGSGPRGYVKSIPKEENPGLLNHIYGRSAYMIYTGVADFRHYNTWYEKVAEPSRVVHWRTETEIDEVEQEYKTVNCELNTFDDTILATTVVDNTAVHTATISGNGYISHSHSLPTRTYGKSIYTIYTHYNVEATHDHGFKHYKTWYDKEPSHNRVTQWRTVTEVTQTETEWKAVCCEMDALGGTAIGIVFIEEVAIATITCAGVGYKTYTQSLPPLTFGRAAYVEFISSNPFKPYRSWFISTPDPTRVTSWREEHKIFDSEQEFRTVEGQIDCLGGTVLGTVFVDSVAVNTFTLTGSGEQGFVKSLPVFTYGRSIYTIYNGAASFKPFATWYNMTPEPPRITVWRTPTKSYSSEQLLRTWTAELNPITGIGNPVIGTLFMNDVAVMTHTFTYSGRNSENVGIEFTTGISTMAPGDELYAIYSAASPFKHYETNISVEPTPYKKLSWIINYTKLGGADQLDTARFWQLDLDGPACNLTCVWDVDGVAVSTSVVSHAGGRIYYDRMPVVAGLRGYLFRLRVLASEPVKIWSSSLDLQMTGIKGLARRQRREGTVEAPAQ